MVMCVLYICLLNYTHILTTTIITMINISYFYGNVTE